MNTTTAFPLFTAATTLDVAALRGADHGFVGQVGATNDLMHRLGLGERTTEILISVVGLLVLESGHAIRVSHVAHHEMGGGAARLDRAFDEAGIRRIDVP